MSGLVVVLSEAYHTAHLTVHGFFHCQFETTTVKCILSHMQMAKAKEIYGIGKQLMSLNVEITLMLASFDLHLFMELFQHCFNHIQTCCCQKTIK